MVGGGRWAVDDRHRVRHAIDSSRSGAGVSAETGLRPTTDPSTDPPEASHLEWGGPPAIRGYPEPWEASRSCT